MKDLKDINEYLKSKVKKGKKNYAVPKNWMPENYSGDVKLNGRKFFLNPYEYVSSVIDEILKNSDEKKDYSNPLSFIKEEKDPSWVNLSTMYGAHIRATAAYIHDQKTIFMPIDKLGYTESGTYLKMIAMIPYFKKMNIDCIYLLPISQSSNKFKKGEVGSPYAVKDYFSVEKDYKDTLLDDEFSSNQQFAAFVQACHIMEIRVMLDFVPRTAARDNKLILDHPEWFYWIDLKELNSYAPPKIKNLKFEQPTKENLEILYNDDEVKKHLSKFRFDPKTTNPKKWETFLKKNKDNPDFFDELIKSFKIITVPGFSDWINDTQPTWDDITFLRLYLSHPEEAEKYLPKNQPPYVLFDVVKSSNFPGKEKNQELWTLISDIMPFYQKNFGIDGARLDMGHALPSELEDMIIKKAKEYDPAFAIIAEELNMDNHNRAKNNGYDGILGNSWWSEPRIDEGWTKKFVSKIMPELSLPAFATSETPDSPRAITRKYGENFSKLSAVINTFMPNGITFINSGSEIFESQPMNTGLDFEKPLEEKFKYLKPDDQFYGKLAFFDWYALHWDTDHHMIKLLKYLGNIKNNHKNLLLKKENYRFLDFGEKSFVMFWWDGKDGIVIPINLNFDNPYYFEINLGYHTWRGNHSIKTTIENYRRSESSWDINDGILRVTINPGEARVFTIK
ncbi:MULTISPECIES: alpha-amylase family glycosyl hydrolase [Oceanotoga]|jgi:glycosidase|uniref:4-alpha-glucanotransferase n=1 Tax=Oceanotoga teriensis TaxID=515440 RepID=A0AA45C7L0_9BACT|nr:MULTISPECIES: alpha-amylase family glycosyl hydrolase [Oceanotoga]MDN5342136.1 hypothetical protein [Oceanotoga sp.]MDO7976236.1 alpha-amylase family glycosyl hydrolase [Oceanotoga teriensis]PWJ95433.1 4-alpha-glucanotransferase [Oceanotoga teriensis]